MPQIITGSEIADAIRTCQPTRIAVAYIGADWRDYIEYPSRIEQIVISPTLGSNPNAIMDLSKALPWEKIIFLDELHAKIYLGAKSAVIGSANLTANGLCGEKLVECSLTTTAREDRERLAKFLDEIVRRATSQYPTTASKLERVAKLQSIWNNAFSRGIIKPQIARVRSIHDFQLTSTEEFYVLWYMNADYDYSPELERIKSRIASEIHFHPEDEPKENRFVLTWRKTAHDAVDGRTKPSWMYIHEIFREAIVAEDYEYTTAAIQRNDLESPPEPFEITDELAERFSKVISSKVLHSYLVQDEENFRLSATHKGLPRLLAALRSDA
jgi:hypothetical protein